MPSFFIVFYILSAGCLGPTRIADGFSSASAERMEKVSAGHFYDFTNLGPNRNLMDIDP